MAKRLLTKCWRNAYGTKFVPVGEEVDCGVVCQCFEAWERPIEGADFIDPQDEREDGMICTWHGSVPLKCLSREKVEDQYAAQA